MKHFSLLLLLLIGMLTLSCRKDYSQQPETVPQSMDELRVSDSFNWKTTTDYHFTLTAGKNGIVEIRSEDGIVFHRANLISGASYKTKLAVPSYVKNLVIFHRGQMTHVELNNELIDLTI